MTDSMSSTLSNSVTENIKCFVRCRPLNDKENDLGVGCIKINEESKTISIDNKSDNKAFENKTFTLDYVFSGETTQEEIFERLAVPVLKGFFQGYNCTIFAYGQTGAGKTHTMLGPLEAVFSVSSEFHGLIPRILHYIFGTIENDLEKAKTILNESRKIKNIQSEVSCSCLEIYQEQIIDLLATMTTTNIHDDRLVIREDAKRGMFIEGLTENIAKSDKSAMAMLMLGLKNRHVAATSMNTESSRSHLIFTIFMNLSYTREDGTIISRSSRLHLIDLAGSERQKATKAVGERIKEAGMINKSLSTLGNVINALVWLSEGKSRYVPFRDSKLTYFLKDSLGGNAKTSIISNISQSVMNLPETISTLKFVQRAKMIKNKAFINEKVNDEVKLLQEEVRKLREELVAFSKGKTALSPVTTTTQSQKLCPECTSRISNKSESNNNTENFPVSASSQGGNIEALNNSVNLLMQKIPSLFNYEDELSEKFKLIDTMTARTIESFFVSKQIYETESKIYLDSLEKKIKQFNNILKFKDNILNEVKEELKYFKNENKYDNNFLEKINSFTNELIGFKQDFELNQTLSVSKLNEENKILRSELETMKYLKEYYTSSQKNSENHRQLFDTSNVDRMHKVTKEFIKSNEELKSFFIDNFTGSDRDDENSLDKFIIITKNEFELYKFQLEEMKINEENNLKMIDELNSENFLMDMELAKYKDKEKEEADGEYEEVEGNYDIDSEERLREKSRHIVSKPGVNPLEVNYIESTPQKRSLYQEFNSKYSEANLIAEEKERESPNYTQLVSDTNKHTELLSHNSIPNEEINLISSSNQASETCKVIEPLSDSKSKNKNEFITNLRNSFTHASPISKALRSSLLHTAKTPLLYSRNSSEDNPHLNNLLNNQFNSRFSAEIKPILIENFEFLKLKQKLDDALINLQEREEEIAERIQEIEESKAKIEELTNEKERIQVILDQQNEEIETVSESNRFLQIDLISLNRKFNLLNNHNEELITSLTEISSELYQNDAVISELSQMFSQMCKDHTETMQEKLINSPRRIAEVLKHSSNNFSITFSSQIETVLKELSNTIIINEIKLEKVKSQLTSFAENSSRSQTAFIGNIQRLEEENLNYSKKFGTIKKFFGDGFNFDFDNQNTSNTQRPFTWKLDKSKLNKLEKRVLELKEEKSQIKCDIALLKLDFNKSLSDKALDSKIHLLMKIKEENHYLKLELIEMKKKNETYERTITNLQEMMNKLTSPYMDEYITNSNSQLNFSNNTHNHGNQPIFSNSMINFEDAIQIKREHKELIDFIFAIGNEFRLNNSCVSSFGSKEEKKSKFIKAMDILKNSQDRLSMIVQNFNTENGTGSNFESNKKNEVYEKKLLKNGNISRFSNPNTSEKTPNPGQSPNNVSKNENNGLSRNKSISKSKINLSLTPTKNVSNNKEILSKKFQVDSKQYMSNNKSVTKKDIENKNNITSDFKNVEGTSNKNSNSPLSNTPAKKRTHIQNVNLNNPNVKTIKIDIKSNVKSAARSNSNSNSNK